MHGLVVSDLHLLSTRSLKSPRLPLIERDLDACQLLVLNGDIFDFHWSRLAEPAAGLAFAERWLRQLLDRHPRLEVRYVLGNHDCQAPFRQVLIQTAAGCRRFRWCPERLRVGPCLFVHGDLQLCGTGMRCEELPRGQPALKARWYTALHRGRLHRLIAPLYTAQRCAQRIYHQLQAEGTVDLDRLRHIYFGHTHNAFRNHAYRGIRFHNTGAAVAGTRGLSLRFPYVPGGEDGTAAGAAV
jgi:UDP-2,3-diacylglucosamine pyrophosphatase LpxH